MRIDLIAKDLSLKLFSLGVAILFFLFVSLESATPVDVDFRIEYKVGGDMMITEAPSLVHTTLQGPWAAFRTYAADDVDPVLIDLGDAAPGVMRHSINLAEIHPPAGMRVVSVRPSELEVSLDRKVERMIPVSADISTRPAFGYSILDVRIEPPRVPVVGPLKRMETIDFINTRMIDVSGLEDDLSLDVDLRPPQLPLELQKTSVRVLVEIGEELVQRVFRDVPVTIENASPGWIADPHSVVVTLKGPQRIVDNLEKTSLALYVDASPEAGQGRRGFEKNVELRGDLPDRVQMIAPVPKVRLDVARRRRGRR